MPLAGERVQSLTLKNWNTHSCNCKIHVILVVAGECPSFAPRHTLMAGRPKHTKPDANQKQIITELRALGFHVDDVHNQPGLYDIVVCGERHIPSAQRCHYTEECCVRVEIKSEGGSFTESELDYYRDNTSKESYIVAFCTRDILNWFDGIAPK